MTDEDKTPEVEEEPTPGVDVESTNTESDTETTPPAAKKKVAHRASHAVNADTKDTITLRGVVFKNKFAKKSLSVHHLQRRLAELGYNEAESDLDGYYGDLTKSAIAKWQADNKHEATGVLDIPQFAAVFADDPDVEVVN